MAKRHVRLLNPPRAKLTVDQMKRGMARIQRRIDDLEAFDPFRVTKRHAPEVTALETAIEETLAAVFGLGTAEYQRYSDAGRLDDGLLIGGGQNQRAALSKLLEDGKQRSLQLLLQAIRGMAEEIADQNETMSLPAVARVASQPDLSKVFIVHGHDGEAKSTVARFVEKLGFQAVILHERPNKGRTIISKFREEAAGVGFAIVLMTPDDIGGSAGSSPDKLRPRARQNVVFELGSFLLAIGPERVAALVKGDIERPSDYDGVVYISLDNSNWQMELARELRSAGYAVDLNKVIR